jgi:ankyrin repeat protein
MPNKKQVMDIFEAARQNNLIALADTLKNNHPDIKDGRGSTPLTISIYYNNIEAASLLLASGADPEAFDSTGNTALMGACFKGHAEAAELLLKSGANPNATNGNGATALTFAATFGRTNLISLLLNHGSDPLIKDRFGKNPIDYAVIQENEAVYELLVKSVNQLTNEN